MASEMLFYYVADASNEGSHSPETIGISARDLDPQNSEDCSVNERSSFQVKNIVVTLWENRA
ncbi:hypothetical protein DPMN_044347 [Dreissena polymorpha]|uniref:Uncharacterized protein n=1 Tax=Dreissena polymorpha TaxID=45954 RepID=A0A9D4HYR3_DREPO|nr:hypothetical protein DPMN_044347 [Dreissena polymorpha]